MMYKTLLVALALLATAVAGCSDGGDAPAPVQEADFEDFQLEVTEQTGIIRGIVVDDAITPIEGVTISIEGLGMETTTNANGAFGFDGLVAGDYFLKAEKAGWSSAQQSTTVQANVQEPPVVKILLSQDPSTAPFVELFEFNGFIECSFSLVAVGFAACSSAGTGNDVFMEEYQLEGTPDFAQSEMIWESTQALGDRMTLLYSGSGESALLENYGEAKGTSPLMVQADKETMEFYSVGQGAPLWIRVFNAPVEGTAPPDPVGGDDCVDRPVLGGCLTGVGATLNQEFSVYTHLFHNMVPQDGWLFVEDGAPQMP